MVNKSVPIILVPIILSGMVNKSVPIILPSPLFSHYSPHYCPPLLSPLLIVPIINKSVPIIPVPIIP